MPPFSESACPTSTPESSGRVLIVEDDARLARGLGRLLRRHSVTLAGSGVDALEKLRLAPAYDAILCDLGMPGMDGVEFYERVRDAFPGVERAIVFMTGGPLGRSTARFMKQIPNPVLQKPFSSDMLEDALSSRLGR